MQGLQAFLPAAAPRNPYRHAPSAGFGGGARSRSGPRVPLERAAVAAGALLCLALFVWLQGGAGEASGARPRLKGARPRLSAQPTALDLMTFNLRFAGTGDGANSWRFRKDHVAELVNRFHPAVMGTQEGLKGQLAELAALLTHPYERFGVEREQNGEFEQIFYDTDVVQWLDGGDFWLSEEPDTPGTQGWDAACVRMVTWSKFRLRATSQEFFFFNTQLDHVGPKSRAEGSKLLWDRIQQITGSADVPLFLMGDFNTYRHTSTYAYFTNDENGPMLYEAWPQAEQQIGDVSYTYHGWAGVDNDGERGAVRAANHIDWIFYRPQMPVVSTEVITESRKGRYPSDHYPIQARVLFPSPADLPPPSDVY